MSSYNTTFPDSFVGEAKYYGVDCDTWLTDENDALTTISWALPTGLTNSDEVIDTINRIGYVKITPTIAGAHIITATITSFEGVKTQTKIQKMQLTVF